MGARELTVELEVQRGAYSFRESGYDVVLSVTGTVDEDGAVEDVCITGATIDGVAVPHHGYDLTDDERDEVIDLLRDAAADEAECAYSAHVDHMIDARRGK